MVIVITGVAGFVGRYLISELHDSTGENDTLFGITDVEITGSAGNELNDCYLLDITDYSAMRTCLASIKPDVIYHLAAQSSVAVSFQEPVKTFQVNQIGTLNLLEIAVKDLNNHPRILLVGSADLYASRSTPITEDTPFHPLNPYAASKAVVDFLGIIYWKNYGLQTVRTRSFNHIGPGQSTKFAMPNFARQIARIEKGLQEPKLNVGNLNVRRDFTDVRDVVRAYRLLIDRGKSGDVYNVCSNSAYTLSELLQRLVDMSTHSIEICTDPERIRPSDNPVLIGDNRILRERTGWKPEIPVGKTLKDLLNYWRERVESEIN